MTSSMLTGTGTQVIEAFLAAFARHDVDAAIGFADSQVAVTVYPFGLNDQGADVLRTVLADQLRAFPDLMITVSRIIPTGDVVTGAVQDRGDAGRRLRRGHQPGEAPGHRPGLAVRHGRRHLFVFHVDDNLLIDDITGYWNDAGISQQLGHNEVD